MCNFNGDKILPDLIKGFLFKKCRPYKIRMSDSHKFVESPPVSDLGNAW